MSDLIEELIEVVLNGLVWLGDWLGDRTRLWRKKHQQKRLKRQRLGGSIFGKGRNNG